MTKLSVRRELQPLTKPAGQLTKLPEAAWHQVLAETTDPDFIIIAAFCTIGLLITINVILRFPDFGASAERYNQFSLLETWPFP